MFEAATLRKTILLALVCLPVLSCGSTPPTLEPVTISGATVVYYEITGATEAELRAQLDALGPAGYDGFKGDATTEWFIHWDWPGYGSSSCDLSAAATSLDMNPLHWI
jgi:predicted secreted Zn-dependent protease